MILKKKKQDRTKVEDIWRLEVVMWCECEHKESIRHTKFAYTTWTWCASTLKSQSGMCKRCSEGKFINLWTFHQDKSSRTLASSTSFFKLSPSTSFTKRHLLASFPYPLEQGTNIFVFFFVFCFFVLIRIKIAFRKLVAKA